MADDETKCPECPPGAPVWMCTFADLMSLLLCFFVLLLSFATMDQAKYKMVAGSMKDAFGVQREKPVEGEQQGNEMISSNFATVPLQIQMEMARYFEQDVAGGDIETEFDPYGLILRIKGNVAFESGRADLRKEFIPLLDKIGRMVQRAELMVEVSGHTDNLPLREGQSAFSSNWSLSSARAVAAVEYLIDKYQLPPSRFAAIGYSYGQPLDTNTTPEGRARNRRVEFKIKPGAAQFVLDGLEIERGPIDSGQ
ncbi:MAG: OmpA family protein [Proteobacteria bacterium]|nr:OmpA family protein [Pseudomonadota bacterium]MBU1639969.1 OmpA family protein [Pseudomonadota bacterium]